MILRQVLVAALLMLLQGCSGLSSNDPRNTTQQWHDQEIEMEIGGLANKPPFRQQARINAISTEGNVLLVGQAVDQETQSLLGEKVQELSNVQHVYNQVRVRDLPTLGEISSDSWITTKVKSQMVASKQLKGASIKVITEGQEVYLLGYVTRTQGDTASEIARNVSGVKNVIKVFKYPEG